MLAGIFKVFRDMRPGAYDEAELEAQLQARGLMYRFFGRFMQSINHTWQLYFVGLIFGIGFDTTTEVVLLAATAYAAIQGLPYYAVLALPFLFAGGLMLFDTLDGLFMNFAYGWAFARPVRKVYYNLVITGLSIGAAFIIGTIEILGVLTAELHLNGAFWSVMANFNINTAGFCIAALFVAVWAAALAYWRFGHVEARWTSGVAVERTGNRGSVPESGTRPGCRGTNGSQDGAVRARWLRVAGPLAGWVSPAPMVGFSALPSARRLGTLPGSGSAPPARFRASGRPAPAMATRTRVHDSRASSVTPFTVAGFWSCHSSMAGRRGPTRREEMIMTQDRARKIATRQRMAETGEPYSVARHAVEREHSRRTATAAPDSVAPDQDDGAARARAG